MPQVKSTSDLQRNIGEIYELCENTREPVYITHKGGRDLVIMDADAFDEAMSLQRDIYAREMRAYDALVASQREHFCQWPVSSWSHSPAKSWLP